MLSSSKGRTDVSTLQPLFSTEIDQRSWCDFVDRYGPKVYAWCRKRGLGETDARDVIQNVLLALVKVRGKFVYDPSKGWHRYLKTVTMRAVAAFLGAGRKAVPVGSNLPGFLENIACPDAAAELAEHLDEEFRRDLFRQAEQRARERVNPTTWEAYRRLTEGEPGGEIAESLGMAVANVYNAKQRVIRAIKAELPELGRLDRRDE
jgi:RNA polymerase sigma-70 factor (ECF subfamily)